MIANNVRVVVVDGLSTGLRGTARGEPIEAPNGERMWRVDVDGHRERDIRITFLREPHEAPVDEALASRICPLAMRVVAEAEPAARIEAFAVLADALLEHPMWRETWRPWVVFSVADIFEAIASRARQFRAFMVSRGDIGSALDSLLDGTIHDATRRERIRVDDAWRMELHALVARVAERIAKVYGRTVTR